MTSKSGNRYSPELCERAVRMLLEQRDNYASDNAAVKSIVSVVRTTPVKRAQTAVKSCSMGGVA